MVQARSEQPLALTRLEEGVCFVATLLAMTGNCFAPRYGKGLLRFARNDELKIALVF